MLTYGVLMTDKIKFQKIKMKIIERIFEYNYFFDIFSTSSI